MNYVPLSHLSAEPCVVCWSDDQRIAVTTDEVVYVLTLRSPLSLNNSGSAITPAPLPLAADNEFKKKLPLFVIGTVLAPIKAHLAKLQLGDTEYKEVKSFPQSGNWPFMEIIDPALNDISPPMSCDHFKSSDWTPPGCNGLGGCLLSCLTKGGRLLLFAPPEIAGSRWTMVMDLTAQHSNHLLSCNFNPKEGLGEKSPHDTIISLDDDSLEPSSSSSSPYNEEYTKRKLSLTVTTFAWLPALLKAEIKGKLTRLALVALATRIGHVVLIGVEVPLFAEQENNVMTLQIIDGFTEGKGQYESWVCSLKWARHDNSAWLAFGCTDGRVGRLYWNDLSLSLVQPSFSLLWKEEDNIPVHCLAWNHTQDLQHSPGHPGWLAASKGALVIIFDLHRVSKYTVVSGIHSVPVSGISSLSSSACQFISSSLDGTVQMFQTPKSTKSRVSHVTPKQITMETTQQVGTQSIHGIAVSKNSLFASVVLDQQQALGKLKARHRFQLHFLPLFSDGKNFDVSNALFSWDVVEYLRQLPLKELSRRSSAPSEPRLALVQATLEGRAETEIARCKEEVLCQHIGKSMEMWLEWINKRGGGIKTESFLCLKQMYSWLSTFLDNSTTHSSNKEHLTSVASKVIERMNLYQAVDEECAACGIHLPISSSQQETCQNGHTWKRCGITFLLVMDPQCGSCMQCGAIFNNTQSLPVSPGSWLEKLLEDHSTCVYCGGHFERVM